MGLGTWFLEWEELVADRMGGNVEPRAWTLTAVNEDAAVIEARNLWDGIVTKELQRYEKELKINEFSAFKPFGGLKPNPQIVYRIPMPNTQG